MPIPPFVTQAFSPVWLDKKGLHGLTHLSASSLVSGTVLGRKRRCVLFRGGMSPGTGSEVHRAYPPHPLSPVCGSGVRSLLLVMDFSETISKPQLNALFYLFCKSVFLVTSVHCKRKVTKTQSSFCWAKKGDPHTWTSSSFAAIQASPTWKILPLVAFPRRRLISTWSPQLQADSPGLTLQRPPPQGSHLCAHPSLLLRERLKGAGFALA